MKTILPFAALLCAGAAQASTQVIRQRGDYADVGGIISMDDCEMTSFSYNAYSYDTAEAGGTATQSEFSALYVYGYNWCTGEANYGYAENPTGITVTQRGNKASFVGSATLTDYYTGALSTVTLNLSVDATTVDTGMYNYAYEMAGTQVHYHGRGTYRSGTPTGTVNGAGVFYAYASLSSDAVGQVTRAE